MGEMSGVKVAICKVGEQLAEPLQLGRGAADT